MAAGAAVAAPTPARVRIDDAGPPRQENNVDWIADRRQQQFRLT